MRKVIAFDMETTGLDPFLHKPILVQWQMGADAEPQLRDVRRNGIFPLEVYQALEDPETLLLGHNLGFDLKMLKHHYGFEPKCRIFDTMLAETVLQAGRFLGVALTDVAWRHCKVLLDKSQRSSFIGMKSGDFSREQMDYAKRDVEHLHTIYQAQRDRLAEERLLEVAQLEFDLIPTIIDLELNGIYLNTALWEDTMTKLEAERQAAEGPLFKLYCPPDCECQRDLFGKVHPCINWDSPKQVLKAFQGAELNVDSTGAKALKMAVMNAPRNEELTAWVAALLGYREFASLVKFDLPSYIHPKTGRIQPEFLQNMAKSGRILCKKPNMQQVPKRDLFRRCVQAEHPDWVLVTADYGQMEMATMAQEAQPAVMLDALRKGLDLHALMAQKVYNDSTINKANNGHLRNVGKTLDFATIFGAGAVTIALQANIPVKEAKRALNVFHRTYPEIQIWWNTVLRHAATYGYTETLAGRKRWFDPDENGDLPYSSVINAPIQGGAADIAKYAAVEVRKRLWGMKAKLIHFVHDEMVVECPKDEASEVAGILRAAMLEQTARWLPDVPVEVDYTIGKSWGISEST